MSEITLPWPARELSPNARCHWAVKAKAVKAARQAAGWATKAAGVKVEGDGAIYLHITFHPPSKRRHDIDNCVARLKGAIDGIADGLGVDDSRFRLGVEIGEVVSGGKVLVSVKGII